MATIYSAVRALPNAPVRHVAGQAGQLGVAWGTFNITTPLAAADTIRMCRLPAGATLIDGHIIAADIDTGTGVLSLSAGWEANQGGDAANATGLLAASVLNGTAVVNYLTVASILVPFTGVLITTGPQLFQAETVLNITCNVAANAGGVGQITMVAYYTQD
jgi:hypothetical protein